LVNATEAASEEEPAIAPDADGGFTVAWASRDQDGSEWGIYARRFDASGAPLSGDIAVNTTTTGTQIEPAITPDSEGGFTVAWSSEELESSPTHVYFRRFDSAGAPLGAEVPVGTATGEGQWGPSITLDESGGFDVAWTNTANGRGVVYARRFDPTGAPLTSVIRVDPTTFYLSHRPAIAAAPGGGFTVTWTADDHCCVGPNQVFVTRFDAAGTPLSTAVPVDPAVPDVVGRPAIAAGAGGFTVAWSRYQATIPQEDILARQFVPVPETTIDEAPPALTNDATPYFAFSTDEMGSTFECKVDDGAFSSCASPVTLDQLTDGPHTFEVRATNPADATDQSPATSSFTLDTVAPNAQIDAGPSGPIDETEPSFSFSTDDSEATVECKLDSAAYSACASPMTVGPLGDGLHSFSVRARDPAGNIDPIAATRSFTVDTQPPQISFDSGPTDGSRTNDATPSFGFEANEEASFECQVDGGAFDPCGSPFTSEPLSDGPHLLTVSGTDVVGHTGSASLGFTVDTLAPNTSIDSGPEGPTSDVSPSFAFDSDEAGSTFECSLDGSTFSSCNSPFRAHFLPDGHHAFSVRAIDEASNTDPTPATRSFIVDTTPPETSIDSGPSSPSNDNAPTFGFSASESGSTFECSLDGGGFSPCASPLTTGPLPDGPHSLSVRAIDQASNVDSSPASRLFTVDTKPPLVRIHAKRVQKADGPIRVRVSCAEDCTVVAAGRIVIGHADGTEALKPSASSAPRLLGLPAIDKSLAPSQKAMLRLKPTKKGERKRLRSLAAGGMQIKAAITLEFTDLAGNPKVARLRIRLSP
jgi:hypothetical protein